MAQAAILMLQKPKGVFGHRELVVEHSVGVKSTGAQAAPSIFTFGS